MNYFFLKKGVKMKYIFNKRKYLKVVKKTKGFTLIELLVVIAVIGVLSSVAFVALGPARKRTRDSRRKADFKQINTAMEICYNDSDCGNGDNKYPITIQGVALTSIGNFITSMPLDPLNTAPYQYAWIDGTNSYYCLYVKLESIDNTWLCSSNRGVFSKISTDYTPTNTDCCGPAITQ